MRQKLAARLLNITSETNTFGVPIRGWLVAAWSLRHCRVDLHRNVAFLAPAMKQQNSETPTVERAHTWACTTFTSDCNLVRSHNAHTKETAMRYEHEHGSRESAREHLYVSAATPRIVTSTCR